MTKNLRSEPAEDAAIELMLTKPTSEAEKPEVEICIILIHERYGEEGFSR
jgi:hypothetical protein